MTLAIGLTGGIGSGKSTVATLFQELGVTVIDTDAIAREVVAPDSTALAEIASHFGPEVLDADGTLNRGALRRITFADKQARLWLEDLLHPLIREEASKRIQVTTAPYCLVEIPLLAENYPNPLVSRVLVVDCPEAMQLERSVARDSSSPDMIKQIMANQATRTERKIIADDLLLNDSSLNELRKQVSHLHAQYLHLSS